MHFLYHRKSQPTGQIIAETLGFQHGINIPGFVEDNLIRWGSRRSPEYDDQYEIVLNPAEAIERASDKFNSLFEMMDAGINTPAPFESFEECLEEYGYPIIGRKFRHARGTDIKLILQRRDVRRGQSDYFIPYIPTNREYRLHVVRDKVIRIQGKYLDFPELAVSHIRNFENGYRFRTPNVTLRPDRLQAAVTAVSSLGLDFGAVDLIIGDDGSYYILEVNTAPSCSRATAKAYINEFVNLLGVDNGQIELQRLENLTNVEQDSEEEDYGDQEES